MTEPEQEVMGAHVTYWRKYLEAGPPSPCVRIWSFGLPRSTIALLLRPPRLARLRWKRCAPERLCGHPSVSVACA